MEKLLLFYHVKMVTEITKKTANKNLPLQNI